MIELTQLGQLAEREGVSLDVMIMEAYQLVILEEIGRKPLAKNLVFKGGTCLRLAYHSFRFSEDLDFSLLKPIKFKQFKDMTDSIVSHYPEISISEAYDMKQTLFARLVVEVGKKRIGIKIEVSKRNESLEKGRDYQFRLLSSPTTVVQPYFQVETLEKIYQDKLKAVKTRKKPRDWFDLWYLSQKLRVLPS